MSLATRKICGRAALIAAMLAGGLFAASMSPTGADDGLAPAAALAQGPVAP